MSRAPSKGLILQWLWNCLVDDIAPVNLHQASVRTLGEAKWKQLAAIVLQRTLDALWCANSWILWYFLVLCEFSMKLFVSQKHHRIHQTHRFGTKNYEFACCVLAQVPPIKQETNNNNVWTVSRFRKNSWWLILRIWDRERTRREMLRCWTSVEPT